MHVRAALHGKQGGQQWQRATSTAPRELPGGLEAGALLVSCAAGVLLAEGIDCGTLLGGE